MNVLHLYFRVRIQGDGVFLGVAENLNLEGLGYKLPARRFAQVVKFLLVLSGGGVKVRGVGEIGHSKVEGLRFDPAVTPEPVGVDPV